MDGDKISSSAEIIHRVGIDSTVEDIINLLNNKSGTCYIPKGVFWLRKGNKNPVSLKTDEDLQKCKQEYRGTNSIRIACPVVKSPNMLNGKYKMHSIEIIYKGGWDNFKKDFDRYTIS